MSMGNRDRARQADLWLATSDLAQSPGHAFYERVNGLLKEAKFDAHVENRCRRFYAEGKGRRSLPPGVYFRMLLIG